MGKGLALKKKSRNIAIYSSTYFSTSLLKHANLTLSLNCNLEQFHFMDFYRVVEKMSARVNVTGSGKRGYFAQLTIFHK